MFLNHALGLLVHPSVPMKGRTKPCGTVAYALALGAVLAGLCPAPVSAVEPGGIRNILSDRMRIEEGNRDAWTALMKDGEARASFCAYCHGKDGNSVMPLVPNLAGQNPFYLLDQIEKFADGKRQDYIMTPLTKQFSMDDKVTLALYYANMISRARQADAALARKGEQRFRQQCVACHGHDAHGGEHYARLAGQRVEYVRHRLYRFQQQTEGHAAPVMTAVAKTLTDADIEALAAYLSTLP